MTFVPKLNDYFNISNVHVFFLFICYSGIIELMSQTASVDRRRCNSPLLHSNVWCKSDV